MSVTITEGQPRTFLFDGSGSPLLFLGEAAPASLTSAPVWRISRVDVTVGAIILFADGDGEYDNVWANRASLDYR